MTTGRGDRAVLIYTTTGSPEDAAAIAGKVVGEGLAACANIFPGMTSVYVWKGAVQRDSETAMLLKTLPELRAAAMAAVRACHPYETPAVLAIPADQVDADCLAWMRAGTGQAR